MYEYRTRSIRFIRQQAEGTMIREEIRFLGCGFNKSTYAKKMRYCNEHGLDFSIYRLGPRRIKKMVLRHHGIELDIEGKDLLTITKEAQEIEYG
jgi:hypothetical protein